jgi:hypothetical protein
MVSRGCGLYGKATELSEVHCPITPFSGFTNNLSSYSYKKFRQPVGGTASGSGYSLAFFCPEVSLIRSPGSNPATDISAAPNNPHINTRHTVVVMEALTFK